MDSPRDGGRAPAFNILLITGDQWRGDCLSAVGHACVRTPALDALAADGVLFRSHYAQALPCGPARASMLTGLYLHNHRAVRNGTPLDSRHATLPNEFRRAGYQPLLFGYTSTSVDPRDYDPGDPALTTYQGAMPGFDWVLPFEGDREPWLADLRRKGYPVPERPADIYAPAGTDFGSNDRGPNFAPPVYRAEDSDTAFMTDAVLGHLDHGIRRPWFFHVSYNRPHPPYIAPEPYNAMVHPDDVPAFRRAPTAADEAAMHPVVGYFLEHNRQENYIPGRSGRIADADDRDLRQLRATYYGMVAEVDAQLARLFAELRRRGVYDDTLIVFTSDHGEQLGDHYLTGKYGFYDESVHVPLILKLPRALSRGERGRTVDAFTESVDLMPTLLELAGRDVPVACDGVSLAPLLFGEVPANWRTEAHWGFDFREIGTQRAERHLGLQPDQCGLTVIRDRRRKYVHFTALPPLFFDLEEDPEQRRNLAEDPARRGEVLAYAQKMLSWRMNHDERTLANIELGPSGALERRPPRR